MVSCRLSLPHLWKFQTTSRRNYLKPNFWGEWSTRVYPESIEMDAKLVKSHNKSHMFIPTSHESPRKSKYRLIWYSHTSSLRSWNFHWNSYDIYLGSQFSLDFMKPRWMPVQKARAGRSSCCRKERKLKGDDGKSLNQYIINFINHPWLGIVYITHLWNWRWYVKQSYSH